MISVLKYLSKVCVFLIFLGTFYRCQQEVTKSKAYLDLMKVHDIAMAEMGNLHNQSRKINEILSSTTDQKDSIQLSNILKELEAAEDGMMNWMAEFDMPEERSQALIYIESETPKIKKVHDDIFSILKKAEQYTNK